MRRSHVQASFGRMAYEPVNDLQSLIVLLAPQSNPFNSGRAQRGLIICRETSAENRDGNWVMIDYDKLDKVIAELEKIGAAELIEMLHGSESEPCEDHDRKDRPCEGHDRKNQRWENQRWENRPKGIQESFEGVPESQNSFVVPEKSGTTTPRKRPVYRSTVIDAEAEGEKKKMADAEGVRALDAFTRSQPANGHICERTVTPPRTNDH